jgi:hypothetical protein
MLNAHLSWAREQIGEDLGCLRPHLDAESLKFVDSQVLSMSWVPLRSLVTIDKAIAALVGGKPDEVFKELGRHSAARNLSGIYKSFVSDEPHRFFSQIAVHNAFQNFGKPSYEEISERSGRITLSQYLEYSPVYCASAMGFYEEALKVMKAPGPIIVTETSCQCAGDQACSYDLKW